jgi:hypothetical protein
MMRANMLYDEPFVAVFPSLVRELDGDVTAAAVLQHVYFRSASNEHVIDGEGVRWWPATLDEIADEIGISQKQARRVVQKLSASEHLMVERLGGTDRRNYYAIPIDPKGPNGRIEETQTGSCKDPKRAHVPSYLRSTKEETRTPVRKPVTLDDDPLFAEFWDTYPRREGKGAARSAWLRAIRKTDPATIIAGAARYRDDKNRVQAYTAHPGTWLNGERWDDEPLPANQNQEPSRPVTYMDEVTDEPCEHGDPRGSVKCALCRTGA